MRNLSATDRAWLAGLIDGEGCVRLNLTGPARCTPYLGIFMKHYATMKLVADMAGVVLQERKTKFGWSRVYGIQLTGDRAVTMLEAVRPYLRTKAQEAWILLESRAQIRRRTGNQDRITAEDRALRVGYSLALKQAKVA